MPDSSMRGKRRAVVIINSYTTLESELHQPYAIAKALRARGVETDVLRNGCFPAYLERGKHCRRLGGAIRFRRLSRQRQIPFQTARTGGDAAL